MVTYGAPASEMAAWFHRNGLWESNTGVVALINCRSLAITSISPVSTASAPLLPMPNFSIIFSIAVPENWNACPRSRWISIVSGCTMLPVPQFACRGLNTCRFDPAFGVEDTTAPPTVVDVMTPVAPVVTIAKFSAPVAVPYQMMNPMAPVTATGVTVTDPVGPVTTAFASAEASPATPTNVPDAGVTDPPKIGAVLT